MPSLSSSLSNWCAISSEYSSRSLNHSPGSSCLAAGIGGAEAVAVEVAVVFDRRAEPAAQVFEVALERGRRHLQLVQQRRKADVAAGADQRLDAAQAGGIVGHAMDFLPRRHAYRHRSADLGHLGAAAVRSAHRYTRRAMPTKKPASLRNPGGRTRSPRAPATGHAPAVTLGMVALAAGVSPSTVSRILNGTAAVDDAKRQAVDDAIKRLGFVPNPVARGLAGGRTLSVGVVTQSIDSPFYGVALRGIEEQLDHAGYSALFVSGHWNATEEARCVDTLRSRRVDGIIVLTGRLSDAALRSVAKDLPVVVTGRSLRAPNLYSVDFDNFEGARWPPTTCWRWGTATSPSSPATRATRTPSNASAATARRSKPPACPTGRGSSFQACSRRKAAWRPPTSCWTAGSPSRPSLRPTTRWR